MTRARDVANAGHSTTATTADTISQKTSIDLSGTYSTHQLLVADAYNFAGDLTVNDNLILGKLSDDGNDFVLEGSHTLQGTGQLEAGYISSSGIGSVDGMTGTLGSGITLGSGVIGTLGTGVTFPVGQVIQTFWDEWAPDYNPNMDITGANDPMGSDLEVTITPKSTSNVLNVRCFIPDLYNHSAATRSLMAGFRYSTSSGFSGSVKLGTKQFPASHELYNSTSVAMLGNLSYEVWIAPPTTSQIWIRPWMQSTTGAAFRIFANADAGSGIYDREAGYLSVQEIQG